MKYFKLILAFAILNISVLTLSAQSWVWANGFTSAATIFNDYGNTIVLAPNGNIYCTGEFARNGVLTADNTQFTATGHINSYITSFDQNGHMLNFTGVPAYNVNTDEVNFTGPPAIDDSGSLFYTLYMQGMATVDTISVVSPLGLSWLSKWNTNARCLWIKDFVSLYNPVFCNGSLYALGQYKQPVAVVDTFHLYDPAIKIQSYLAKLDKQGNCKWLKQATGGNIKFYYNQVKNNSIYISAQTDSCFSFDTIHVCGQNGIGLGLLIQTDTNGLVRWCKTYSAASSAYGIAGLSSDISGNCYVLGYYDTTFYIGSSILQKRVGDLFDGYIAKYDTSGNLIWLKRIYCTGQTGISPVYIDSIGYIYLTGYICGTTIFDSDTLVPQTANDLFVTRLTPSGNYLGFVTVPNASGYGITEDSAGNAFVTGAVFTSATFGNTILTASSYGDFFVAKLSAITDTSTGFTLLPPGDSLLQIYANPSRGLFTVVVPQSIVQASNGNLMVYDSQGGLITNQQVDISGTHVQVDLGEITRGVYTVLLSANGKEFRGRVVIQ